jgi:molybdopterin converting factor small subunit
MYVEFLGIPRERMGIRELQLEARTLGQALAMLAAAHPEFRELLTGERLVPSVAANLNLNQFIDDPETPLAEGDRLLILSADAGG